MNSYAAAMVVMMHWLWCDLCGKAQLPYLGLMKMKCLKIIIWIQLFVCLCVAFIAYAKTVSAVYNVARTSAYVKELKKDSVDSAKFEERRILDYTQIEFAEYSSGISRSKANLAASLIAVSVAGGVISILQIFLLGRYQRQKQEVMSQGS